MAKKSYDDIADWYDSWVGGDSMHEDPIFPAVEALMGDIAGQRVCDLACGQGRVARHLADLGARVTGIDLSAKLLAIARRHEREEPRGIAYLRADAGNLDGVAAGTFDGVICHMALMDIPDLASTLHSVARVLRPGGWFVFAILHPCYNTSRSGEMMLPEGWVRTIGGYFIEGYWRSETRTGPPGKVGAYHHTLSTYVTALTDAGLTLERVHEPRLTGSHAARRPIWAEVPAVLVVRCCKSMPAAAGLQVEREGFTPQCGAHYPIDKSRSRGAEDDVSRARFESLWGPLRYAVDRHSELIQLHHPVQHHVNHLVEIVDIDNRPQIDTFRILPMNDGIGGSQPARRNQTAQHSERCSDRRLLLVESSSELHRCPLGGPASPGDSSTSSE